MDNWLLERNVITVGALIKNSCNVPNTLRTPQDCQKFSATCHFEAKKGDIYLNRYTVNTKSSMKKNGLLMTLME